MCIGYLSNLTVYCILALLTRIWGLTAFLYIYAAFEAYLQAYLKFKLPL